MNNKNGIVYVLKNESMQGYIKIGYTNGSLKERVRQLQSSGVPAPFNVCYACEVNNAQKEEAWVHKIFEDSRPRIDREFFVNISPESVRIALERVAIKDVTPKTLFNFTGKEKKIFEQSNKRKANFDFKKYDIPLGSELFFRDSKAIVAKNNKVEFNNKIISHSEAAKKVLNVNYGVNGSLYWRFEDETLDERRKRMD